MVLQIAERLRAEGKRVGILTRGYRGSSAGTPGEPQSDEVAIYRERLQHHVHLGVGPDRFANGQTLARHGVEWFVLDDGFQHMQLARDIDIVLIDATDPFGGGHLLPAGLLREPKSALARADIIIITRADHAPAIESIVRRYSAAPIFYATTELLDMLPLRGQVGMQVPAEWRAEKIFAFCGIGNADAFFNDLIRWGFQVAGRASFPDHHSYFQEEISQIVTQAMKAGASALVCTEKDVFNLRGIKFSGIPVGFVRIAMSLSDADKFWETVRATVKEHQEGPVK
jgi:tetraacyldisaccharide 4'-kinase